VANHRTSTNFVVNVGRQPHSPVSADGNVKGSPFEHPDQKKSPPGATNGCSVYGFAARRYDAAAAAASSKLPILVLQGERDFQVTRADYDGWVKALGGRANAKLKLYPGLNHLFERGEGAPRPAEYETPGLHVAAEVVSDVAAFVTARQH